MSNKFQLLVLRSLRTRQEFGDLTSLTELHIDHNGLHELCDSFSRLTNLKELFLHNNSLGHDKQGEFGEVLSSAAGCLRDLVAGSHVWMTFAFAAVHFRVTTSASPPRCNLSRSSFVHVLMVLPFSFWPLPNTRGAGNVVRTPKPACPFAILEFSERETFAGQTFESNELDRALAE